MPFLRECRFWTDFHVVCFCWLRLVLAFSWVAHMLKKLLAFWSYLLAHESVKSGITAHAGSHIQISEINAAGCFARKLIGEHDIFL